MTDFSKGYKQAKQDIREELIRVIKTCTRNDGKIDVRWFIKEIEIEVFPNYPALPNPMINN